MSVQQMSRPQFSHRLTNAIDGELDTDDLVQQFWQDAALTLDVVAAEAVPEGVAALSTTPRLLRRLRDLPEGHVDPVTYKWDEFIDLWHWWVTDVDLPDCEAVDCGGHIAPV